MEYKSKKNIQRKSRKKIVTGGIWSQFKKVKSGDIIVVFGGNHSSNKYVTCSACSYSHIIKKAENKRNKKYRDLIRILKLNENLLEGQNKSYAFCPKRSMREHPNYGEFGSVRSLNKKNKLIHVLTNVNKDGKSFKYEFINIKNKQHKKELIKILAKRKWKTEQDSMQLIESFYFNKNGIKKYDY